MKSFITRASKLQKLLLSFVALGVAGSMAGLGTFAAFTSSTSASQTVGSGTLTVALGAVGSVSNRLNIAASAIAPQDTIQRTVDLLNSGSVDFGAVALTTTAPTTTSLLDTDATNGLQMTIDKCSVPWTEGGTAPAYTYTCSGTTASVVASRAVIGANIAMSNLSSLTAGSTDHLRVTLTLPNSAGNTFQAQNSVINHAFAATQRAGTNK